MANINTKRNRIQTGHGKKTGEPVNSSARRRENGKKHWVGASPPRKPKPVRVQKGGKQ
jgi:hypothetical protein